MQLGSGEEMKLEDMKIGLKVKAVKSVIRGAKGVVRHPDENNPGVMWVEFDFGDDPNLNMVEMSPDEVEPY